MILTEKIFPNTLPSPCPNAQKQAIQLTQAIAEKISQQHGKIPFETFMQYCLYYPDLGYYSGGSYNFGPEGDFITAPEITPLFSQTVAQFCVEYLKKIPFCSILEFGAGSGKMAADILLELDQHKTLPENYFIMEISSELKNRQKEIISRLPKHLVDKVKWLERLPDQKSNFIILGNEVLDAMPVAKFYWHEKKLQEYYIEISNGEFIFSLHSPRELLRIEFEAHALPYLEQENHYESEINLYLSGWFNSLSDFIDQGIILLIDYGFLAKTFYHPQRNQGTIMCHYQHRTHDNPLVLPGLQDVTAHVDFSHIINSAAQAGFSTVNFESQSQFLIRYKITQLAEEKYQDDISRYKTAQSLKYLLLPSEMGELFKVIALKSQAFSCPT